MIHHVCVTSHIYVFFLMYVYLSFFFICQTYAFQFKTQALHGLHDIMIYHDIILLYDTIWRFPLKSGGIPSFDDHDSYCNHAVPRWGSRPNRLTAIASTSRSSAKPWSASADGRTMELITANN